MIQLHGVSATYWLQGLVQMYEVAAILSFFIYK